MQIYTKNKKIKIKRIANKFYFINKNGQHIRTDELGASIWKICSKSNFAQLKKRLNEKLNCPHDLLKNYLHLLTFAGIIKKEDEKDKERKKKESISFNDLVSLIVINFNGEEFVADCLNSIREQTHKNKEIIFWDNNSSDHSLRIVCEKFPEAKVVAYKKNILFARAVNLSIERCRGDYIIILNPDTVLDEHFISELLRKAKEERKAACVVPKMLFYSLPTCINGIGNYVPSSGWGSDNFIGHFDFGQFDNLNEVPSACFGAVMLKRKALSDIGPIDNHYEAYYEDADWSYRARLRGWKIVFSSQAIIYHKFELSFKNFPNLKSKLIVRNRLRFAVKIFSFYYLRGFLKNYLKEDLMNFLHFRLRTLNIYLLSYLSILFQLPELLLLRIKTQKSRNKNITDREILNLAPRYPPLLDEISAPILTVESIRNIYVWQLNQKGKRR
jgi:GT2 family glycosyltransferase